MLATSIDLSSGSSLLPICNSEEPNSLQGTVPSTLSQRLKRLEADELIEREIYSGHPIRVIYKLTEKGRTLGSVLLALKKWGEQNP